jgi:hypothetical protein
MTKSDESEMNRTPVEAVGEVRRSEGTDVEVELNGKRGKKPLFPAERTLAVVREKAKRFEVGYELGVVGGRRTSFP